MARSVASMHSRTSLADPNCLVTPPRSIARVVPAGCEARMSLGPLVVVRTAFSPRHAVSNSAHPAASSERNPSVKSGYLNRATSLRSTGLEKEYLTNIGQRAALFLDVISIDTRPSTDCRRTVPGLVPAWWYFSDRRSSHRSPDRTDRKSTRLNSSHRCISYAVFCLKKNNDSQRTKWR